MFHGFEGEFVQAAPAVRDVFDDLLPHAWFPEFLEMVRDAGYSFISRIAGEEKSDLVRHVDHILGFHGSVVGCEFFLDSRSLLARL
jgi:hypothetical protein